MSGQRLRAQFTRLYHHFNGEDSDTTLQAIADILVCTRRNARMVLNKLEEQHWLTWAPSVGRGKLSRLTFLRTESALRDEQAAHWLAQGKMDQALACLDNDSTKLAALIQKQLGPSTLNGRQIVRLPYYRQLESLDPRTPLRRSEEHLVGQIFNGLVKYQEGNKQVCADLAHHWEALSHTHWRFYLRPGVRFHDGRMMREDDVVASLSALSSRRFFAHIAKVTSPAARIIDITLSSPDPRFDHALTLPEAVILPADCDQQKGSADQPIGTGPYRVAERQDHRLVLQAFDDYFGYRALTDEIQLMVFDEAAMCYLTPSTDRMPDYAVKPPAALSQKLEMDQGAGYLMLNCRDGLAKSARWRAYLHAKLSSLQLLPRLAANGMGEYRLFNAYGLMPGWIHHTQPVSMPELPGPTRLSVAYLADHPLYPLIATAIEAHLAEEGIQVETMALSPDAYFGGKYSRKIDIWLGAISFGIRGEEGLFNWLGNHDLFLHAFTDELLNKVTYYTTRWREQAKPDCAEALARELVAQQVVPLFHIWTGVVATPDLQDVASNAVGWFDFQSVWYKPSE